MIAKMLWISVFFLAIAAKSQTFQTFSQYEMPTDLKPAISARKLVQQADSTTTDDQVHTTDDETNNEHLTEQSQEEEHHYLHPGQQQFWVYVLIATCCTITGAFCSGVAIGLMSIQTIELEIMERSDDPEQRKYASRILPIKQQHHLFLVTLLLANAIALESLPIVVHALMPDWAAILFSTIIVLIAAQIVPQALCTGPKKIVIAYHACVVISVMIKIFWVLSYPISKGLDYMLGEHTHQRIQHKDFANFLTGGAHQLKNTQKLLLTSILQLRTKRVPQVMIPLSDMYMLSLKDRLTTAKIQQINTKDYSYILVYKENRSNVVGVIKTKQFALKYVKSQKKNIIVQDLFTQNQDILCVYEDTNLLEMLMLFQTRNQRYSLVIGKKRKIEPGIQSVMYSKSDMVAKTKQGQILGVVFIYKLFETITQYNDQVASVLKIKSQNQLSEVEMQDLNQPLLH